MKLTVALRPMLVLATIALSGALVGASHGLAAPNQTPDCEDPDTVACLPTGPSAAPGGGAQPLPQSGPNSSAAAAAPGPGLPPYPIQVCLPPPVPYPVPMPFPPMPYVPGVAAAGPIYPPPTGYPCPTDVFGTINRANLAYARAMRSLDGSALSSYWTQDALQGLLGQIANLQASGSYRVLRLLSIQPLDQSISATYAFVHTTEHWRSETWSYSGYRYDVQDAWYDNQYYLYNLGGRWLIGTDTVR